MSDLEIERRFLVDPFTHAPSDDVTEMRQVYLARGNPVLGTPSVRIRQKRRPGSPWPSDGIRTLKWGEGISRIEREVTATATEVTAAFAASAAVVEKWRYRVGRWEIDVFQGALAGRQIAEIELTAVDEALPDLDLLAAARVCLRREVTDEGCYNNAVLAFEGWPAEGEVAS